MTRWATHLFIASYLGLLGFGLAAHAFTYLKSCHPAMYFIVWDMFCGWSAYETRVQVVGEGASGQHYLLAPAPWGAFVPYGSAERQDYDTYAQFGYRQARNTLAHTEHEPIHRIFLVEQSWNKKFNLPAPLWEQKYLASKPAEPRSYYSVLRTYNGSGDCLTQCNSWLSRQSELCVLENPRLRADMRKGHTFYATNPASRSASAIQPAGYEFPAP